MITMISVSPFKHSLTPTPRSLQFFLLFLSLCEALSRSLQLILCKLFFFHFRFEERGVEESPFLMLFMIVSPSFSQNQSLSFCHILTLLFPYTFFSLLYIYLFICLLIFAPPVFPFKKKIHCQKRTWMRDLFYKRKNTQSFRFFYEQICQTGIRIIIICFWKKEKKEKFLYHLIF